MGLNDLKVAIIGSGSLSSKRIYPYIGMAHAQLVGVCDLDLDKAAINARRFGGNAYNDYKQMLQKERPDAVFVCIGPGQHALLAEEIMRLGIPVYTEKPPAATAEEALKVAKVSHETGVLCSTAFKKRYNIAYSRAKEWIAQYDTEDLYSISVVFASKQYKNLTPRNEFLLDFGIHVIDLISFLYGDAKQVFCFSKAMDAYAVGIRFANGAVGTMDLNCARSFHIPTERVEISIKGGNFMSIDNSSSWKIAQNEQAMEWREPSTFVSGGDSGNDTGHLAEIVNFLEAVRNGQTTKSAIYESYKSMVLYEAIKQSAVSGKLVEVKYEMI